MKFSSPTLTGLVNPLRAVIALLVLTTSSLLWGQVATQYSWSQSTGTYSAMGAAGVNALFSDAWDDSDVTYTLPFTFNYDETAYTKIRISSNGFFVFGTSISDNNSGGAYVSNSDNSGEFLGGNVTQFGVAGFNADLIERTYSTFSGTRTNGTPTITGATTTNIRVGMRLSGSGIPNNAVITNISGTTVTLSANATASGSTTLTPRGNAIVTTTGTSPNRTVVVQYTRVARENFTGSDDISFQILLNEGGGNAANQTVQVVFGTVTTSSSSTSENPQVGIRTTISDYNSRTSTTSANWQGTTASTSNSNTIRFSSSRAPTTGLTYTWTPDYCTGTPTAGSIGGTSPLCTGTGTTLTLTGNSTGGYGLSTAWSYGTVNGGPYPTSAGSGNSLSTGTLTATRYYVATTTCSNGGASATTSQFAVVVNSNPTTSNAGADQTVCILFGATLAANAPSSGTGTWTIQTVNGGATNNISQFSSTSANNATFTPITAGVYTLRWTIANSPCTSSTNDMVLTVRASPTTANAGPTQSICTNPGSATMAGNTITSGAGSWSLVSGPSGVAITTASSPTTSITGMTTAGTYTLRWTATNSPCSPSTDDVLVVVTSPSVVITGSYGPLCANDGPIALNGTPIGGTWSGTGVTGNNFDPSAGTQTITYTHTNGPCTTAENTTIIVNPAPGAPTINMATYAICQNTTVPGGQGLSASCAPIAEQSSNAFPGSNFISEGTTITTRATVTIPALPPGAVVTGARLKLFNVVAASNFISAQRQNIRVALSGAYTLVETQLTTTTGPGTVSPDPVITLASFPIGGGTINIRTRQTTDNFFTSPDAVIGSALIEVEYTLPTDVRWYTASTNGTLVHTGELLDPVGVGAVNASTPGTTSLYATCAYNACENVRLQTTFDVIAAPIAGGNNTVTLCSVDAPANIGVLLGAHDAGSWSGPSAVIGDLYDPVTMDQGAYVYTVTGTAPCANTTATIMVTETPASTWYADSDGDSFGNPGDSQLACVQPVGYVADNSDCDDTQNLYADGDGDGYGAGVPIACGVANNADDCPTVFGAVGGACDAGPAFVLGELNASCACVGVACTTNLNLDVTMPAFGTLPTWQLRDAGTNLLVQSGGGGFGFAGINPTTTCLPDGTFKLIVNGMPSGGAYVLRTSGNPGTRIIDNQTATNGSTQVIEFNTTPMILSSTGAVHIPVGPAELLFTSCDKPFWKAGEYVVVNEDADVAATWVPNAPNSAQSATSGYDFWIYNPNGGYSYIRQRRNNVSDNFGAVGSARTCHMKVNNWASASHIPNNVKMNIRVRAVVNNVPKNWGPACRFVRDEALAICPPTKLFDVPGFPQFYSCGVTRAFTSNATDRLYSRPVTGANKYKFTITSAELATPIVKIVSTYYLNLGWTSGPLMNDGETYDVTVQASFNNGASYCIVGEICLVTINNNAIAGQQNIALNEKGSALNLWPNPN
ncbi:MAG TPA: hypothetical protein PLE71_16900, partial [Flavobacteriales bacterium]|nr:hypothetical protein [Flavobacteriales bacterium]